LSLASTAQDTLYHTAPGIGHERILLYNDGTFHFRSSLCGFVYHAHGTYKKRFNQLIFKSDTTNCPQESYEVIDSNPPSDSIAIQLFSAYDSSRFDYLSAYKINGKPFAFDWEKQNILFSREEFPGDSVTFQLYSQEYKINGITSETNEIRIYLSEEIPGEDCGKLGFTEMKKTLRGYEHTFFVYDEDPDNYYKKTKRKVTHVYKKL
jgi:hypothetical protein